MIFFDPVRCVQCVAEKTPVDQGFSPCCCSVDPAGCSYQEIISGWHLVLLCTNSSLVDYYRAVKLEII
jgi:hypothetical protein